MNQAISYMVAPGLPTKSTHESIKFNATNKEFIDIITQVACHYYSVTESDLKKRSRKRDIVRARYMIFYVADRLRRRYSIPGISLAYIGACFGLEHCNVIHGRRKVEDESSVYDDKREEVFNVIRICETKMQRFKLVTEV